MNNKKSTIQLLMILSCALFLVIVRPSFAEDMLFYGDVIDPSEQLNIQEPGKAIQFLDDYKQKHIESLTVAQTSIINIYISKNLLEIGDYTAAKELIDLILMSSVKLSDSETALLMAMNAILINDSGNPKEAIKLANKALSLAVGLNDPQLSVDIYVYIASVYSANHQYVQALQLYQQAFTLISVQGNEIEKAHLQLNMAYSYFYIRDIAQATKLTEHVLAFYAEHQMYFDMILAYQLQSLINRYQGNTDKAINLLMKAAQLSNDMIDQTIQYDTYLDLTTLYLQQGNLEQAQYFFELADSLPRGRTTELYQIKHLLTQAEINLVNGDGADVGLLILQSEQALQSYDKQSNALTFLKLYQIKVLNAEYIQDFESALLWQKEIRTLEQNYFSEVRKDARAKYKVLFDTEQALLKNELLEQQKLVNETQLDILERKSRERNLMVAGAVLTIVILIYFFYRLLRTSAKLNTLANTDGLTKLANRRATFKQGESYFQQESHINTLILITFDIDQFKAVNDTYGHAIGDQALINISAIAQKVVRKGDVLGRIGGEEFLLVLPSAPLNVALKIAERLRDEIRQQPIMVGNKKIFVSASFGICEKEETINSFSELYKLADDALYTAKNNGRNQIVQA